MEVLTDMKAKSRKAGFLDLSEHATDAFVPSTNWKE